jgi:hypothetical protein
MLHRIRLAMQTGTFQKLGGPVEVDETFIGGKARNMHKAERKRKITGTGPKDKTPIIGVKQRGGELRAAVVRDTKRATLDPHIERHVEPGTTVYTDTLLAHRSLSANYDHATVDHAERYVDGQVHVNGLENFWSLLKRGLNGTYVSVEPFHLFRYLDERLFTYNLRDKTDYGRFEAVLGAVSGRRLTFAEVTGQR